MQTQIKTKYIRKILYFSVSVPIKEIFFKMTHCSGLLPSVSGYFFKPPVGLSNKSHLYSSSGKRISALQPTERFPLKNNYYSLKCPVRFSSTLLLFFSLTGCPSGLPVAVILSTPNHLIDSHISAEAEEAGVPIPPVPLPVSTFSFL